MSRFLSCRTIDNKRNDYADILAATGIRSGIGLALRSLGLSLADQYWYRPAGSTLTWKEVSCFDNEFDPAFGEALLQGDFAALAKAYPYTPDSTLGGISKKAWLHVDGRPMLLKSEAGTSTFVEQSELLSAKLTERLLDKGDYVRYVRYEHEGKSYIACRGMAGQNEEFIPTQDILLSIGRRGIRTLTVMTKNDRLLDEFTETLESFEVENITAYYA